MSHLHSHCDYTIGWVCALHKEQTAATAMLDVIHDNLPNPPKDPNAYTLGSIGKHNIVIACLPDGNYGTVAAATAATWMASTFPSVRFGLMVGIGGGIPSNKIRLGDVVVSKPDSCFPGVIQWDRGKIDQGSIIEHTGSLNNPPTTLLTSLSKLGTKREMEGSQIPNHLAAMREKWPALATKYTRLESLRDTLFADDCPHIESPCTRSSPQETKTYSTEQEEDDEEEEEAADCRFCDMTKARKRKPRATRIHYGLIASGNKVVKDAQFRNQLNERFSNKILCVEMEAAGLMNDFPCLVIRGICDYADSHKNKAWQEYAAAVAAAFAKELLLVVPVHAVEQMDNITSILSDIRGDLGLAVEYLEQVKAHRDDEEDGKILEWLNSHDYGAEHSDVLKRWQPGTGQWLLESTEFQEFIKANERKVLFCPGIPGAGKTVMAATVIAYLHKQFGNDQNTGIAYIYFNFRRHSEQTPIAIFSSLLKQLSQQQPSLPKHVKMLHETCTKKSMHPSLEETLNTFHQVVNSYSSVFVIIDALDECAPSDHCRETILSEIVACTEQSNLKLFATSRHIPEISKRFQSHPRLEIKAVESDIRRYVDSRLSKLPLTSIIGQSERLQVEITARISDAVNGMFLLARLHLDSLTDFVTRKAVMKALNNLPTGSNAYDYAYNAAMDRINQQSTSRKELAINALAWVTHAKRPLFVAELLYALGVEIGEDEFDEDNVPQLEDILSTTVGLITIDEKSKVIRLVHYTTQHFFERTREKWFPNAETYLAEVCSSYLSFSIFETPSRRYAAFLKNKASSILWKYAITNWKLHVTASRFSHHHLKFLRKTSNLQAVVYGFHILEFLRSTHGSDGDIGELLELSQEPNNVTSLHVAAESGWHEIVDILLKDIVDADERDSRNRSPFHMAASGGHCRVMDALLKFGKIDVDVISNESRYTPLICAAQGGHTAAVKLLLGTGNVNIGFKCRREKTALWYAAVGGHVDIVRLLLDPRNYAPDTLREIYSSALLGAIIMEREVIVNLLLETGHTDMNVQTTHLHHPFCWDLHPDEYRHSTDFTWSYPCSTLIRDGFGLEINNNKSPLILLIELGHEDLVKLFLAKEELDVDLKMKSWSAFTPLCVAAYCGRVNIFQILFDSGRFDLNSRGCVDSRTPLMTAASKGHTSIVEFILSKDITTVNWCDRWGHTALLLAIHNEYEKTSTVELLIKTGKANISIEDGNGLELLHGAAEFGHENIFRLLFEMLRAEINWEDKHSRSLLLAAVAGGKKSIVKTCLDTGRMNINARDDEGMTPILLCAREFSGGLDILKMLLGTGNVDFDARDHECQMTALLWAVESGSFELFMILFQTGKFDINARDVGGFTPLMSAARQCSEKIVGFLLEVDGVDLYTRDDEHKRTALMWAAYGGNGKSFLMLLKTGKFDVNERDVHGLTPLTMAAKNGREDIVNILLQRDGVDLYTRDYKQGRTALMWAASHYSPRALTVLVRSKKFDPSEVDKDGLDALAILIK